METGVYKHENTSQTPVINRLNLLVFAEKRMYGDRENTTLLYLGPPQASYVTPRKKVQIPGVPNHTDSSTVDFMWVYQNIKVFNVGKGAR